MGLPIGYSARNLTVRRSSTALTAIGIALTVGVFTGVVALYQGFVDLYRPRGSESAGIYLRPGASSEGESGVTREQANIIIKGADEIAKNANGEPLAAAEVYLAVYMNKLSGGRTNVPLRGVQRMSLELHASGNLDLLEGQWPTWGANEVVVGAGITGRIENCRVGDTIRLNLTDFKVVGMFEHDGMYRGEIWGDAENMMTALERPVFQRIIAECKPGTDFETLGATYRDNKQTPLKFISEREYLSSQTTMLGPTLLYLAGGLIVIMGTAAILGAIITMLATVTARTHEIGVLLAIGFPRGSVFRAFLMESCSSDCSVGFSA